MKNITHDLVHNLAYKSDALWRYDEYAKNANDEACERCVALWQQLKEQDKKMADMIKEEIANHVGEGKFD